MQLFSLFWPKLEFLFYRHVTVTLSKNGVFMFWSLVASCKIKSNASASGSVRASASACVCECVRVCACASAWQHRGTAGKLEVRWESVCRCLVSEREREREERCLSTENGRFSRKKEIERERESVRACDS